MRLLSLLALFAATPVLANTNSLSADIATKGLTATEAQLAAISSPAPDERFALAGVRFLRVVETALQAQAREGLFDPTGLIPFARLGEGAGSSGLAPRPEAVREMLTAAADGLDKARAPLDGLSEDADFGVVIDTKDIWFDVNGNGTREPAENAADILGPVLLGWQWAERDKSAPLPVVRFDAADAAWLSAYTHLLGGTSEFILAYDPTEAIRRVIDSNKTFRDLSGPAPAEGGDWTTAMTPYADNIAVVLWTLRNQPDVARMASVRSHLQAMVADNRRFWTMVARETDNDREWLPNDAQTAALGIEVPKGTGARWLAVLDDLDALLSGKKLVPYWRVQGEGGINLARFFDKPAPLDAVDWIQGSGALPYLEKGPLVDAASWRAFENLVSGRSFLFAFYLN